MESSSSSGFGSEAEMKKQGKSNLPVIGWREWVGLPEFGIKAIKVKVDTGARSSSLHAHDLHVFERGGAEWARFQIHPVQRSRIRAIETEARILEFRSVRSSTGKARVRPVILTEVALLGITWPVELTLASRDEMGFRMLLGREAVRRRFLVDAGKSYYGGRHKPKKKRKKKDRPRKGRIRPKEKQ
jgi:hypothetical protein